MTYAEDIAAACMTKLADSGMTESIVYRPYGGTARTINAAIQRPSLGDPYMSGAALQFIVTVLNSATSGVSSAELDTGRDQIDIAERPGGTATSRTVHSLISQSSEYLAIGIR